MIHVYTASLFRFHYFFMYASYFQKRNDLINMTDCDRGSEVMREVAWVIYDEVHYMRDKERGVVWEESIILLPHKVRFVFLSATIPNAEEFVGWVSKVHHQPCHVVYTEYR